MLPPEMAPWNLVTRFGLEIVALIALGLAGWNLGTGGVRWVLALLVPIAAALAWTTFNVRGDPSRSGNAPVEVSGRVRLAVELLVLGAGAVALWHLGRPALAAGYAAVVAVQYATSFDRLRWLVRH